MDQKFAYLCILIVTFILSGCTTAVVLTGAAAGTYAITQDYVTTSVDVDFHHAWQVANQQLAVLGSVDDTYHKLGEIKALINEHDVKVRISRLTDRTVDIRVAARKNLIPNQELAKSILTNIMRNL